MTPSVLAAGTLAYLEYIQELGFSEIIPDLPKIPAPPANSPPPRRLDEEKLSGKVPVDDVIFSRDVPHGRESFSSLSPLKELAQTISNCNLCQLAKTRGKAIFGLGQPGAKLMIVLTPPSAETYEQGRLTGPAWELLEKIILNGLKLNLEDCYITPIIKCSPPDNLLNIPTHVSERCSSFIKKEIDLIKPRLVLTMGALPAQSVSALPHSLGLLRPMKISVPDFPHIPLKMTYSLEHMLEEPEVKKDVWNDLQFVINTFKTKS